MKKIIVLLVLLLIFIPLAFFSFRENFLGSTTTGPVTLNYWGVEQDEAAIQPLIDEYQAKHSNIKVIYRRLNLSRYRETLESRIKENKGPDIFRFHNTWTPMLAQELSPLPANVMDDKLTRSRFYPIIQQDLKVGGKIVGVPQDFDGLALVYNTAFFSSAGYTNPPTDWFQFRQMARKMTIRDDKGQILVGGAALGTSTNVDYFSDILGLMFLQNGTKMINKREISFHNTISTDASKSNLGADALSFYTAFVKDDKVWDRSLPSSVAAFGQGKAAMIFVPARSLPEILDLARKANPPIPFAVAPVPQLPNRESVVWGSFWAEGVSVKSKHPKEAWDFISFLLEKESLNQRFNLTSQKNSLGLPYGRQDMKDELASNPYLGAYLKDATNAQSWYMASRTLDNGLNDKMVSIFATAINAAVGSTSPVAALQAAAKDATETLTSYNLINRPTPE